MQTSSLEAATQEVLTCHIESAALPVRRVNAACAANAGWLMSELVNQTDQTDLDVLVPCKKRSLTTLPRNCCR